MAKINDIIERLKQNPKDVRFSDLCKVCEFYFGEARQDGGSHRVYKTPWQGDPRVNVQNHKGKAKAYQVTPRRGGPICGGTAGMCFNHLFPLKKMKIPIHSS